MFDPPTRLSTTYFGSRARTSERLSLAQRTAICNDVYTRALALRSTGCWSDREQHAFLVGAISAFHACSCEDDVPAFWSESDDMLNFLLRLYQFNECFKAAEEQHDGERDV